MKSNPIQATVTASRKVVYQDKIYNVSHLPVMAGQKLLVKEKETGVCVFVDNAIISNKWCDVPEIKFGEPNIRKSIVDTFLHSYQSPHLPPKNQSEWIVDELAFLSAFRNSSFKDRIDLFMTLFYELGDEVDDIVNKPAQKLNDAYLGNELDYMMMCLYFGLNKYLKIEYLEIAYAYQIDNGVSPL